ncbi:LLM class flavin-dependent oxidoreductase [Nocardia sp. NPDC003482]|uniref:LLM class flavin-dependent oxidoreductase n=1 Tax=Nocardia sp. NPDC004068 TaxID=3364303 RepID=UPI0036B72480
MPDWGVLLTTAHPPYMSEREVLLTTLEHAELAERNGFHSAWLLEHHFTPYGICPDTITLASHILGRTTDLHVGTAVLVQPFMHPVRLAESTALLDQISGGRFHLGLGRGCCARDYKVFDVDPSQTHAMLHECVDIMRGAWTQEEVGGKGPQYRFDPVPVFPKPYTTPHPPVYVGGESPSTVQWAAEQGLPLLIVTTVEDEEIRSRLELYNETAEAFGHDVSTIGHMLTCVSFLADTAEEAKKQLMSDLIWWADEVNKVRLQVEDLRKLPNYGYHLRQLEQRVLEGRAAREKLLGEWMDKNPVGPAEHCVERLEELIDIANPAHIVLGFEGAGDRKLVGENIERFATEVLSKVSGGLKS